MSVYVIINLYYAVETANSTAKHAISNTEMLSETLQQSIFRAGSDNQSLDQKTKTSMVLTRLI